MFFIVYYAVQNRMCVSVNRRGRKVPVFHFHNLETAKKGLRNRAVSTPYETPFSKTGFLFSKYRSRLEGGDVKTNCVLELEGGMLFCVRRRRKRTLITTTTTTTTKRVVTLLI